MATPGTPTITHWAQVRYRMNDQGTTWLATTHNDGRPHVVPVGAYWIDGAYIVTTGQGTIKGAHLAANPHCVLTRSSRGFDVIVEGEVEPRPADPEVGDIELDETAFEGPGRTMLTERERCERIQFRDLDRVRAEECTGA